MRFTAEVRGNGGPGKSLEVVLNLPGVHNVQNALAAIAVAQEMGLPDETIRRALAGFAGVKRRFTKTGEAHGITVIDDYGHHPVEIAATLRAARQSYGGSGRVIAVMQPHRYTRLASLRDDFATCFADADAVLIADVYAAGEAVIEGVNRDMLVNLDLLPSGSRLQPEDRRRDAPRDLRQSPSGKDFRPPSHWP